MQYVKNNSLDYALEQRGLPIEVAKQDHRRALLTHPTQSTGYWCDEGDTLEILCFFTGKKPLIAPELWIIPIVESPESEGRSRQVVQLEFGRQYVKASRRGVIYFAALNFPVAAEITAQIVSGGRLMPSFVFGKSSSQDWAKALIDYPESAYGELVGQRMIVAMPLSVLKREVDDPAKVTSLWDKVVTYAEDCYGLSPYNSRPHRSTPFQYLFETMQNRAGVLMSASHYWLGTTFSAAERVCNSTQLTTNGWGPWHELGHHYQLVDMNWAGLSEVTVNIVSMYVQRELRGDDLGLGSERWDAVFKYLAQEHKDFDTIEDLFVKLGMFWQLDLTFGKDFYARLGHRYRTLPESERPRNNEEKVQLFILEASRVSLHNLTPFFVMWGIKLADETRHKLNQLTLRSLGKTPIWKNTDTNKMYTYGRAVQNLSGKIVLPDVIHEGGIFEAQIEVDYKFGLAYKWEVPYGFRVLGAVTEKKITLIAPDNIIHNSSVLISITVNSTSTNPSIPYCSMPFGSKVRLKVTEAKAVYPGDYVDKYMMKKYNVNELHSWSESRQGNVGDIYLGAWSDGTREYFRLKKVPYHYFPTDQTSNYYWDFLGQYNDQYYLDDLTFDNVIATRNDRVVGAANYPMSDLDFLMRVGAETTDGSIITLSPKPAECSQCGSYCITLIAGHDGAYRRSVIYDVMGDIIPKKRSAVLPKDLHSNESWCGTSQDKRNRSNLLERDSTNRQHS